MPAETQSTYSINWLTSLKELDQTKIISPNTQELIDALTGSQIDIDVVKLLISKEPLLSAKLLMISNSTFIGFPRTINHLDEAIVLIGAEKLKTLIYTSILMKDIDSKSFMKYVTHSLLTALYCKSMAEKCGLDSDTGYIAGLFHIFPVILNYQKDIDRKLSMELLRQASEIILDKMSLPIEVTQAIVGLYSSTSDGAYISILRTGFSLSVITLGDQAAFQSIMNLETDMRKLNIRPEAIAALIPEVENEKNAILNLIRT